MGSRPRPSVTFVEAWRGTRHKVTGLVAMVLASALTHRQATAAEKQIDGLFEGE